MKAKQTFLASPTISFSKNWNKKLDCDFFTTVRLFEENKEKYYLKNRGKSFDVLLNGKKYCSAKLVMVEESFLEHIVDLEFLCYLDAGLNGQDFFGLMKKMYSKRLIVDGRTVFLILMFARLQDNTKAIK